ncbi:MAG: hypothetical protein ACREJU_17485 [Nitrospiraceae bacterium]
MTEPSQETNLHKILIAFLRALPSPEPLYCLIGGLALGTWGTVRATQDVDVLMLLDDETRHHLISVLAPHGFVVDSRWAEANPMLNGVLTRFRHGFWPVDLLQPRDLHERETLAQRRLVELEEMSVWVASPEDLILLKMKAGRDQDFLDAVNIVTQQRESLQLDYLWSWADRLGLQGELTYILKKTSSSTEP